MRGIIGFTFLLSLIWTCGSGGNTPIRQPVPVPSVEQLVDQLGDPDYQVREAATRFLHALGPITLPNLRKAVTNPDPEVRRRLEELIPTLEKAAVLAPRRITLHVVRRPLEDILAEVSKQTGYKISSGQAGTPADKHLHSFDFDQAPFWEVMDRVCEAGNLTFQDVNKENIQLAAQDSVTPHVYRTGPFRFVANGFQYTRTVDFAQAPRTAPTAVQRSESLSLNFSLVTEPKLPLIGVGEVKVLAAYDEEHRSMVPLSEPDEASNGRGFNRRRRYYRGGDWYHQMGSQVQLVRPSRDSQLLKSIKGTVMTTLLAEEKPVLVSDNVLKAKSKSTRVGKTTWTVVDVTEVANPQKGYRVEITITNEEANDPNWSSGLYQRIELEDAKGNKYTRGSLEWSSGGAQQQGKITFYDPQAKALGPPARLIYKQWKTLQHPVSFEFKDLPLP